MVFCVGCGTVTHGIDIGGIGSGNQGNGGTGSGSGNQGNGGGSGNQGSGSGNQGSGSGNQGSGSGNQGSGSGNQGNGGETEELVFTVTLYETRQTLKGVEIETVRNRYYPSATAEIYVYWAGSGSSDKQKVNSEGVATSTKLDGDYRVSLDGLPSDLTYNPNGLRVDNFNRDIEVDLIPIVRTPATGGNDVYNCINISQMGAYKVTLSSKDDIKYYQYGPTAQGWYSIQSIVDTEINEVNPSFDRWTGQRNGAKYKQETISTGGSSGTYTKNFYWDVECDGTEVGNVWIMGIHAEATRSFPLDIYFLLTYEGDFQRFAPVTANGPFYTARSYTARSGENLENFTITGNAPTGAFRYSYMDNMQASGRRATDGIVNQMRFRLFWEDVNGNGVYDEGDYGDGYYHFYSMELYPNGWSDSTGTYPAGWGPLLWGLVDGSDGIRPAEMGMTGYPFSSKTNSNYLPFQQAYRAYAKNSRHPVTKEMMEMYQDLAFELGYFNDGDGVAECGEYKVGVGDAEGTFEYGGPYIDSAQDYMFLIFCGYYS